MNDNPVEILFGLRRAYVKRLNIVEDALRELGLMPVAVIDDPTLLAAVAQAIHETDGAVWSQAPPSACHRALRQADAASAAFLNHLSRTGVLDEPATHDRTAAADAEQSGSH